jgi:hypothetical protein
VKAPGTREARRSCDFDDGTREEEHENQPANGDDEHARRNIVFVRGQSCGETSLGLTYGRTFRGASVAVELSSDETPPVESDYH